MFSGYRGGISSDLSIALLPNILLLFMASDIVKHRVTMVFETSA